MENNNSYPIAAIATPSGVGALAVIRISGFSLKKIFSSFANKKKLPKPRIASLTNIYNPRNKKLVDSCIITYFQGPKSFTGEDVLEISCHGGNLIPELILESLSLLGVKRALPGEFSYRAFLNNKIDLIQAESISSLISSTTDLSHDVFLKNLNGYFSRSIVDLTENLTTLLIILENELNFNEDEITFTSKKSILKSLFSVSKTLKDLNNTSVFGKVIRSGFRVVFLGRPNVGKSSLFNHLLGTNRAIVSALAGTTRDTIESFSDIGGYPVCFVDTAGVLENPAFVDSLAIKKTIDEIDSADWIFFIDDKNPIKQYKNFNINIDKNKLIFINSKCEILPKNINSSIIYTSIKNGRGIDKLINKLSTKMSSFNHSGPTITTKRQKELISVSLDITTSCIDMINNNIEIDLIVSNVRDILYNLELITGKIFTKDVIDNIFSNFCIGK